MQALANVVVVSSDTFLIDQERQALFKGQLSILGVGLLLAQPFPKGGQAQSEQFVQKNRVIHFCLLSDNRSRPGYSHGWGLENPDVDGRYDFSSSHFRSR